MSLVKSKKNGLIPASSFLTDVLDLDRFFDNDSFFKGFKKVPFTNIREKDDRFEVELAAPGMDKQDFKVEIDNDILTVSAERKEEKSEEKEQYTRQEFSYSSFTRSFELPATVNAEAIQAAYKDGILKLTLPKKEEASVSNKKAIEIA
ncbi:heat shock protein Hsp20 [Pontibacter ummariensis]|uniref:Heat shock protein Hsp20 n=1 Tax=Pontibacter ummariensis TaxID=1610492 RepID=A0A239JXB8_9BACT|nr:Hsp20/alpha crystallin family protein [Pontibacter ummariensis]PRY07287.1 heat shock protein Hsp20 [Pontibacter ummariensis]SNT10410.1 heat shock protein Hsp20 [Pontibacter ummariensis]